MMVSQGKIDIDKQKNALRIERERKLLDADTTENWEAREIGAEWFCRQAIDQLDIASFLRRQGWDEDFIGKASALLITRTVYRSCEYKSLRIIQETSAVCELFGLSSSAFNTHNISYVCRINTKREKFCDIHQAKEIILYKKHRKRMD